MTMSTDHISASNVQEDDPLNELLPEADGGDSDLELEAAVQAVADDEEQDQTMHEFDGSSRSAHPQHAEASSSSDGPPGGMMPPPRQSIPQDLSLIAEMVSSHQVVGSFPPLSVSAAEKRRLVMESMRSKAEGGPSKGKGKETEREVVEVGAADDSDSDSDSSSEFLSEAEEEPIPVAKPMSEQEHAAIKQQLDKLVACKQRIKQTMKRSHRARTRTAHPRKKMATTTTTT